MEIPDNLPQLTALFRKFGASDPEGWARSQIEDGFPQLQRFLFLRQAWKQVCNDDECGWIQAYIQHTEREPDGPYADVGRVFALCLQKGVEPVDLASMARALRAELLFSFCYLLEDPNLEEKELADFAWGLFEIDDEGNPVGANERTMRESRNRPRAGIGHLNCLAAMRTCSPSCFH